MKLVNLWVRNDRYYACIGKFVFGETRHALSVQQQEQRRMSGRITHLEVWLHSQVNQTEMGYVANLLE